MVIGTIWWSGNNNCVRLAEASAIDGAALDAVTSADAALLLPTGSAVSASTAAMLVREDPSAAAQFTAATIVTVSDAPAASNGNAAAGSPSESPHTPPPVALHETRLNVSGRWSTTTTSCAGETPLFVTTIV